MKQDPKLILEGGFFRSLTRNHRVLPDYLIIGAAKCGTSSMYENIIKHPSIMPAFTKEIHFFTRNYSKGVSWYHQMFPTHFSKKYIEKFKKSKFLTGEASPSYLSHGDVPERVFKLLPNVKLIAMLRNPVNRSFSRYQQQIRQKKDIVLKKVERGNKFVAIPEEEFFNLEFLKKNPNAFYKIMEESTYINGLERWKKFFPEKQLLIIKSEDFFSDPERIMKQVFEFLGVSNFKLKKYEKKRVGGYLPMKDQTKNFLVEYFKPYNKKLNEKFKLNFEWN